MTDNLDADLISRQSKLHLLPQLMELKSMNLTLKQSEKAKKNRYVKFFSTKL